MGLTKPRAHQLEGSDYKASVRVVTVANVNLSGGAPTSVDGVTLVANDRVLVTAQSTGSQNGIYRVKTLGTGSNGTWVRSKDADTNDDVTAGMVVMITEGTTYADTQWKLTTNDAITVGTTSLTFSQRQDTNVAGSDTQVQFNDGGALAGDSGLVFAKTSNNLTVSGNVTGGNLITSALMDSATIHTSGLATLHSATVEDLTDDQVVVATTGGRLANTNKLTFDESTLAVTGAITASTTITATANVVGGNLTTAAVMDSATIHTSGLATLHSATVEDLTDDQVVVATTGGRLANTNKLTFDESTLAVTGALTVSGESTLASAIVSDLTDNRVVIAGSSGAIEDDANFTFDGTTLGLSTTGTDSLLTLTATENSSTASPVITLKRNSGSVADADYLGRIIFKGENDADQEVTYARVSGKILDASDGTEDGIIEISHIKAGSQVITSRFRSDSYQLLNSTSLTVNGAVSTDSTVTATGNITGGNIISSGRFDSSNGGAFRWFDSDGSNYFDLKANGTTTASVTYTWPAADGSDGQVLSTNGSGVLTWEDGGGGASGFSDSTITTHPAAGGDEDLRTGPSDDTAETPFEATATDAFGVAIGSVYDQMEPTGSTTTVNLGAFS